MNGRQVLALAICCLMFSTLYIESVEAQMARKKRILKIIIGASSFLRFVKPKKGILPVPLPLPIPLPIEWEQPPIVVHPKQHHVPVPVYHPQPEYHHQPYPAYPEPEGY